MDKETVTKAKPCDYNHLILYAKGHYKRGNRLDDVRRILAFRAGLDRVSDEDVWQCVVHAMEEHCPGKIGYVVSKLFRPMPGEGNPFIWFSPVCPLDRAVYYATCELAHLTVIKNGQTVLELGEPDPKILPLGDYYSDEARKRREERTQ